MGFIHDSELLEHSEPSYHRHVYRHRANRVGKTLSRYHDGNDAHDDELRAYSKVLLPPTGIGLATTGSGMGIRRPF